MRSLTEGLESWEDYLLGRGVTHPHVLIVYRGIVHGYGDRSYISWCDPDFLSRVVVH